MAEKKWNYAHSLRGTDEDVKKNAFLNPVAQVKKNKDLSRMYNKTAFM